MRTYEDVKLALKYYQEELNREKESKSPHYVIVGGNMSIIRNGTSIQFSLGKGNPVPMIKSTADKNVVKFQAKCEDGLKLEVVKYDKWLEGEIKECNQLCDCMMKEMSTSPLSNISVVSKEIQSPQISSQNYVVRKGNISIECPECPFGVNKCVVCRYFVGVDMEKWSIKCSFIEETK